MKKADSQFMAKAIALAKKPVFSPHPNPRVGCIIVKDDKIIGEGYHDFAGGPHAEINALKQAGQASKQSTVYITLEPCSHFGKTPPCANALIEADVARVVIAMKDPNPLVAGKGINKLLEAGIAVESEILESQAKLLNKGFIKRMTSGMPWITSKIAMSLDGRTAMASGESQWITSAAARKDVHLLRARCHAILTGSGTVMKDNPSLTVRDIESNKDNTRQPIRVLIDSSDVVSKDAKIFSSAGKTIHVDAAYEKDKNGKINLNAMLSELGKQEINEILIEAGPSLNGALLSKNLIDEFIVYMAPDVMGDNARAMFSLPHLKSMNDKISFECTDIRKVGRDIRLNLIPTEHTSVAEAF